MENSTQILLSVSQFRDIFKANHQLLTKQQIPTFYLEIHNLFMKLFKKEPENVIQILNEPLWLNKHIIANNQDLYDKDFEKKIISQLKDILDNRCKFLDHSSIKPQISIKHILFKSPTN